MIVETIIQAIGGSTKGVRVHLSTHHRGEWKELEENEKLKNNEKEKDKKMERKEQPTIKASFEQLTKVDPQGKRQARYDEALLELLASKFIPFDVVNSVEFKNFVGVLDKSMNFKHAVTYSRQMGEFSEDILVDVKKAVDEFCDASAAITTDLWTSRARHSYISITLHFIDKLFRLHRLDFKSEKVKVVVLRGGQMSRKRESLDVVIADVTLACEDEQQVKAHKVILACPSPLLSGASTDVYERHLTSRENT